MDSGRRDVWRATTFMIWSSWRAGRPTGDARRRGAAVQIACQSKNHTPNLRNRHILRVLSIDKAS
jgi:hypothetical protein